MRTHATATSAYEFYSIDNSNLVYLLIYKHDIHAINYILDIRACIKVSKEKCCALFNFFTIITVLHINID